jgi:phage-related protein
MFDLSVIQAAFDRIRAVVAIIEQMEPVIGGFVDAAEKLIPISGQGAAKLELVKQKVALAFSMIEQSFVSFDQLWPYLEKLVGAIVAVRNTTGAFTKG